MANGDIRESFLISTKNAMKELAKSLKRYSSDKLTLEEYTALVEIRETCNRIIEDEMCRG